MSELHFLIFALILQLVCALLTYIYIQRTCTEEGAEKKLTLDIHCLICSTAAFVGSVYVFTKGFPYGDASFLQALANGLVFIWLMALGYIDLKKKIIPNEMILLGLAFWVVVLLLSIFAGGENWLDALMISALGGVIIGGVMLIIALLVKSALGMGDVKLFFVLGLLYGASDTYSILLCTVVIMALCSVVLLLLKKATTKTAIPMAPFAVLGFLLSIIAGM